MPRRPENLAALVSACGRVLQELETAEDKTLLSPLRADVEQVKREAEAELAETASRGNGGGNVTGSRAEASEEHSAIDGYSKPPSPPP